MLSINGHLSWCTYNHSSEILSHLFAADVKGASVVVSFKSGINSAFAV